MNLELILKILDTHFKVELLHPVLLKVLSKLKMLLGRTTYSSHLNVFLQNLTDQFLLKMVLDQCLIAIKTTNTFSQFFVPIKAATHSTPKQRLDMKQESFQASNWPWLLDIKPGIIKELFSLDHWKCAVIRQCLQIEIQNYKRFNRHPTSYSVLKWLNGICKKEVYLELTMWDTIRLVIPLMQIIILRITRDRWISNTISIFTKRMAINGFHLLRTMFNFNSPCLTHITKLPSNNLIAKAQLSPTPLKHHGDWVFSDSTSTTKDMVWHTSTKEWKFQSFSYVMTSSQDMKPLDILTMSTYLSWWPQVFFLLYISFFQILKM